LVDLALQGTDIPEKNHSRSSVSVLIDTSGITSYLHSVVTYPISSTISEVLRFRVTPVTVTRLRRYLTSSVAAPCCSLVEVYSLCMELMKLPPSGSMQHWQTLLPVTLVSSRIITTEYILSGLWSLLFKST